MREVKILRQNIPVENQLYPWANVRIDTARLADITVWDNQSDNPVVVRVIFTIENNEFVKVKLFFTERNQILFNQLQEHSIFHPKNSDRFALFHEFIFNKNHLSELHQFFTYLSEIEFYFPVIANHLLASVQTSMYITSIQRNTLPQSKISLSLRLLHYLQLAIFALLQQEYQKRNPVIFNDSTPTTFMGTAIFDIPFEQLLILDGKMEDAEEILQLIRSHSEAGKSIFQNPNLGANQLFSAEAISLIKQHPICREAVMKHEQEQNKLAQMQLSDAFYTALHTYLMKLFQIGDSPDLNSWGYMTPDGQENYIKLSACMDARERFFETIKSVCTKEEERALEHKIISVPVHGGAPLSGPSVKFAILVNGVEPYNCIITQQIFLWAMLRAHNPEIITPEILRRHPQAAAFNLGGLPVEDNDAFFLTPEQLSVILLFHGLTMAEAPIPNGFTFQSGATFVMFIPRPPNRSSNNQSEHQSRRAPPDFR